MFEGWTLVDVVKAIVFLIVWFGGLALLGWFLTPSKGSRK